MSHPRRQSSEVLFQDKGSHRKWCPEDRSCRILRNTWKTTPTYYQTADGDDVWINVVHKNSCSAKQFDCDYVVSPQKKGSLTKHNSCHKPRVMSGNCLDSNNKKHRTHNKQETPKMYRVMRFLEGISFQRKHETVSDSAHVTSRCENSLPLASASSHFQLTFLSLYTFSSSSSSFNYLVCLFLLFTFFSQRKVASDLYSGGAYFESWLGHKLSWLRIFQVFLNSFKEILGKYVSAVSFHVLSSSLITIIQSFDDIVNDKQNKQIPWL